MPVDASCRIQVTFPSDMPLTADLTTLTSTGILSATNQPPTWMSVASNSFYIDGCTSYQDVITNSLNLFKMKNRANVATTYSFTLQLWAVSGGIAYPIAQQSSDLIFPQASFTPGTITEFLMTATDTNEVQNYTRYTVQMWPVHAISATSLITL